MGKQTYSLTVELGRTIRRKRKELGLTQEALAEGIGVGNQALSRIEHGQIAPKMDRLPIVAEKLRCSVADLFRKADSNACHQIEQIVDELQQVENGRLIEITPLLIMLIKELSAKKS